MVADQFDHARNARCDRSSLPGRGDVRRPARCLYRWRTRSGGGLEDGAATRNALSGIADVGGELEGCAGTPTRSAVLEIGSPAPTRRQPPAASTASSARILAFTLLRRRPADPGSTEPVCARQRHMDQSRGTRSIDGGCMSWALTVALTIVGAVSCASAVRDQGQTRAPK